MKPGVSKAQTTDSINNGYYISYPEQLMLRLYLSQKYAPFTISSDNDINELNYKTNSKLYLGVGATYRSLTLNLSFAPKSFNKEKGKGETKGLDFQFHLYPHKWAIDLLGSFRKGYYLDPRNKLGVSFPNYYLRPDINRDVVGFSAYRVPNSGRFSYRAALVQNDRQLKSSGSVLFGAEAYYGALKGDSALVPNKASNIYSQAGIDKVYFISIGPGIGYAYTLVIAKYFFITGSAAGHLDANFSTEKTGGNKKTESTIVPDFVYKGALGYNSDTWSISANIMGNALYAASKPSSKEYFLPTGNLRFIVAKKIGLKKH